jgi:hypothetical protein
MLSSLIRSTPFYATRFPTLNWNDIPVKIIHKTGDLLSKNINFNCQALTDCFENDTEFFIQSEPVTINKHIRRNVDLIHIHNFYRDLCTDNKNFYFYRSWFRFENRTLRLYNVLENLNHPSGCNKTTMYMYHATDQVSFVPIADEKHFLKCLAEIKF